MKHKNDKKIEISPAIEILHKKDECLIVTFKNPDPIKIKYQDKIYSHYAHKYYNFAGREYVDKFVKEALLPQLCRMGLIN